jgi:hypothetical protein
MNEGTGALQIHQGNEPSALSPVQVGEQVQMIQQLMRANMKDGEHFGKIPGCGDKPALLKPGAEKLCLMFRLAPKFEIVTTDLGNGHREITVNTSLYHINTGAFWGAGVGSCSTMETKFRYRGNEAVSTGVPVPKEYWDLKKTDFKAALEKLGGPAYMPKKLDEGWMICEKGQKQENPDIADTYNTVLKMAKKRSLVDATLSATAASDIFTQDIEENAPVVTPAPYAPPVAQRPAPVEQAEAGETYGIPSGDVITSSFLISEPIASKNKPGNFYRKAVDSNQDSYYVHSNHVIQDLQVAGGNPVTVKLKKDGKFTSIVEVIKEA